MTTGFVRYPHLEKFGHDEVDGIEIGTCFVFPKLDGTNASVWIHDGVVLAGSRNRTLTIENDNAGFYNWVLKNDFIRDFLLINPHLRLYGEWLVPHSLKTYREDAWNRFYVFDAYDNTTERFLSYDEYREILSGTLFDVLAPLAIVRHPTLDSLNEVMKRNTLYIKDGQGVGEGIVVKNYSWQGNKYGRVTWAKLITTAFKEIHHLEMGAPVVGGEIIEEKIVNDLVNEHLVNKTYAKIVTEEGGWSSKYIPRLLATVYYDLVTEELWNALKKHKQPTIHFKILNNLTIQKIKQLRPDIF